MHFQAICQERDGARGEINKDTYECQQKEGNYLRYLSSVFERYILKYKCLMFFSRYYLESVDQGMAEIRKLNSIIKQMENNLLRLRQDYEVSRSRYEYPSVYIPMMIALLILTISSISKLYKLDRIG